MAPKIDLNTSTYERIQLNDGPRVDIYVGTKNKHYRLPKNLLCSSSSYFDRCFNGAFAEAQTQTLTLEEDLIAHWEILLEFIYSGKVATNAVNFEVPIGSDILKVDKCMDFMEYADKYDLGGASIAVHDCLQQSFKPQRGYKPIFPDGLIELVFRVVPPGSQLRALVTKAALNHDIHKFKKQEVEVHGYAAEVLAQLRIGPQDQTDWIPPLSFSRRAWV